MHGHLWRHQEELGMTGVKRVMKMAIMTALPHAEGHLRHRPRCSDAWDSDLQGG